MLNEQSIFLSFYHNKHERITVVGDDRTLIPSSTLSYFSSLGLFARSTPPTDVFISSSPPPAPHPPLIYHTFIFSVFHNITSNVICYPVFISLVYMWSYPFVMSPICDLFFLFVIIIYGNSSHVYFIYIHAHVRTHTETLFENKWIVASLGLNWTPSNCRWIFFQSCPYKTLQLIVATENTVLQYIKVIITVNILKTKNLPVYIKNVV